MVLKLAVQLTEMFLIVPTQQSSTATLHTLLVLVPENWCEVNIGVFPDMLANPIIDTGVEVA